MNRSISSFLMVAIILQPFIYFALMGRFGALGTIMSSADEIMLGGFALSSLLYMLHSGKIPTTVLVWFVFVVYSVALVLYRGLPTLSYIQILLDSKIFLFGIAAWLIMKNTPEYDKVVLGTFKLLILLSVGFSIWQIVYPDTFYSFAQISDQTRAGAFSTASGAFQSRVAFSQFLIVAILLFSASSPKGNWLLFIAIALLFISFSRKEILFFLFGYALFYVGMSRNFRLTSKVWIVAAALGLTVTVGLVLWSYSSSELGEDYVRYIMLNFALEITGDYFPTGTGPGTYGSLMSLQNTAIYDAYDVSDRIVYGYGWSDFDRGPIFDLFLINLTVEYGAGVVLPLIYIYYYGRGCDINHEKKRAIIVLKVFLVYSALLTPAFSNPTAFLTFIAISSLVFGSRRENQREVSQ